VSIAAFPPTRRFAVPLLAVALLCGCSRAADTTTSTATAITSPAAEPNAAGDIPDTQAFVIYASPQGYRVLVPEGWSRRVGLSGATFTSQFDGERVSVRRRSGPALPPSYVSQSMPNKVTGKSVTLEHRVYVYPHGSREAVLDLWAPQGSDNADQWKKISQSFRWQ
jgi:hypothetical protein